jgi:hypothetical protein
MSELSTNLILQMSIATPKCPRTLRDADGVAMRWCEEYASKSRKVQTSTEESIRNTSPTMQPEGDEQSLALAHDAMASVQIGQMSLMERKWFVGRG